MRAQLEPEELLSYMPGVAKWERALRELNIAWRSIESTARMVCPAEAKSILPTVRATRDGFNNLEKELIANLVHECTEKCVQEIHFRARVIIEVVVRNLFERTADVGFLAMDQVIRDFVLDEARDHRQLWPRLLEYRNKYTVYDEILILDTAGTVLAHLDTSVSPSQSRDPLIAQTLASDTYVETFRKSDLRPGAGESLIYSRKIVHPRSGQPIGVLCLCFPLAVEMTGVFKRLREPRERMVMLMLDRTGRVIASSDEEHVRKGAQVPLALEGQYEVISFAGRDYFAKTCAARDYQGYSGPGWYGHVMIPCESAFRTHANGAVAADEATMAGIMAYAETFCPPLHDVVRGAEKINVALRRVIWNGQVMCAGDNPDLLRLKAVLQEVSQASVETGRVFRDSIDDLYATVLSSSLQSMQAMAHLYIDIMDRSLYERANDCRWWALAPDMRALMARQVPGKEERMRITRILEDINSLYTAYVRLVVFDTQGTIVAASNLRKDDVEAVETQMDADLVRKTLALRDTQSYCVSPFEPTPLYGGRPTYIYCAAIRHPQEQARVVGGIGIVFDAEPEFRNMLEGGLTERTGAFAAFTDRHGNLIASTDARYPPGGMLRIDGHVSTLSNGEKEGWIDVHEGQYTMVGSAVSAGYREYKNSGDYQNDVVALVCVPIGALVAVAGTTPAAGIAKPLRARGSREHHGYAVFTIHGEKFALPVEAIQEAVAAGGICRSATLKPPLMGMLNFARGENEKQALLPVIDMHCLIRSNAPDPVGHSEIIVVRHGERLFGLCVGGLIEVLDVGHDEIEPAVEFGRPDDACVRQIIKTGQGAMIQVLDPERLAVLVFGTAAMQNASSTLRPVRVD